MKNCIRIPRLLLPEAGFEDWAVISRSRFSSDRAYWERVKKKVGEKPSTLNFCLPQAYAEEDDEARVREIYEAMYLALENGDVTKLNRGAVLVKRSFAASNIERENRYGVVLTVDLEAVSFVGEKGALIRPAEKCEENPLLTQLRETAPLEFTDTVLFYRDKRQRAVGALLSEELEELYSFNLIEEGGRLTGFFVPDSLMKEILPLFYDRSEPCFAVAAGAEALMAAKTHWEALKPTLKKHEMEEHPARFALVEIENLYDEGVELKPVHRLICDVEKEAFFDYFMKSVKCRREGDVLEVALSAVKGGYEKADEAIEKFLRANGGSVEYFTSAKKLAERARETDCVGVRMKAVEKDEFFALLAGGKQLPPHSFSLGREADARYYLEGREIGYD